MSFAATDTGRKAGPDIRIIEDRSAFDALEGPWRKLDAQPGIRPFQEFGWLASWVRTIGRGSNWRLRVCTLWQDGRLLAVLPLCIQTYKGVRLLEWIASRVSDYCDALVDSDVDADMVLRSLWDAVNRGGGFDVARLSHVRTDARVFKILSKSNPWVETAENAMGVPVCWATGEEWLQQLSRGMRDRVQYNTRRMLLAGFKVCVWDGSQERDAIIDTLVAQKRRWLAKKGLRSFLDNPEGVRFLHSLSAAAAARSELHLSTVQNKDHHVAACDLTFVREGTLYSYIASFDEKFAKYSFGRLLTDNLIMWACEMGLKRLDLLLGAYEYKTEYGCTAEPVRTMVIPRGLRGRAALAVYRTVARKHNGA